MLKYRSEIDGLRALAVFPVVFYHAGFELFSGGFVGVDVFFIISGYLITSLILNDLKNNNFSLANFYERRARRIFPALFVVVFFTSILSFVFLTRSELGSYFKSVIATIFFYSNFYFWKNLPYFESETAFEPLLHTWSLSIEEQFYIAFPLFLIFLHKYYKKSIIIFLILVFTFSFLICQWAATTTAGTLNFYFTFSRAWELALGGIAAYCLNKNYNSPRDLNNIISFIGILLILYSIFFFNKKISYPSFYTLVPAVGTVFIILFAKKNTYVERFLSLKFLVGFGLLSYSFYLWHQPLLTFGRIYFENYTTQEKLMTIMLSLFLSYLTWKNLESRFRQKKKINLKKLLIFFFIFLIFIVLFAIININFFSSNSKNSTESRLAKLLSNSRAVYSTKMDERQFIKNRIIYEFSNPKILVVGSSRLMQVSSDTYNQDLLNFSVSGASVEDHITIVGMALEKFNPEIVLLGADPWLFNQYNEQKRWKSLAKEYDLFLSKIKNFKSTKNFLNLEKSNMEPKIYEEILEKFYNSLNIRNLNFVVSDMKNSDKQIIMRDGRRIYGKKDIKTVEDNHGEVVRYSMERIKFSEEKFILYNKFIDHLINNHKKEVVLVLSPYYQEAYKKTIDEIPAYLEIEQTFRDLAQKKSIKIIGSYDPKKAGCKKNEFYDSSHPKEICMRKIINQNLYNKI